MAKGINALAIDVGDGAVGIHVQIAAEQADANHGAGFHSSGILLRRRGARGYSLLWLKTKTTKIGSKGRERGGRESRQREGRQDVRQAAERRRDWRICGAGLKSRVVSHGKAGTGAGE